MEFNISSAGLLKGILDVAKALPAKTTALPILENFLFVLKDGRLGITASDQELTLRTSIEVQGSTREGSIAVPARQMIDLLKALPDQPITIRTGSGDAAEGSFECLWSNGNSSLPYFSAADYPEIKGTSDDAMAAVFPADVLCEGISSTIYATADDEMRPAMNGIFFDMDTVGTTLVASDSHKLVCYTTTAAQVGAKSSFILHKKPASVLKSIIDKVEGDVHVAYDASNVVFSFGDTMMVCRLIVGKFPDYRRVIPQNNSNVLRIDRARLLDTVRRVAVCANKASNHIKFDLRQDQLEITAQDLGFALAAYEKLDCEYSGEDLSIGFKSSFLIEMLSNMGCGSLVVKFADSYRAALIVPADGEEESGKLCGILMPIKVS